MSGFRRHVRAGRHARMPGTLVAFHAHPDDEVIATGGSIARAAAAGIRVVLVTATGGELGEVAPGVLDDGEELATRRALEVARAGEILGVSRIAFLGYLDSGMAGEPTNEAPGSFASAPIEEAAERLAAILREEDAEVLTIYDENGNYGHPDHIQVHRVGVRASELAQTPRVFEATLNRDHIVELMTRRAAEMGEIEGAPNPDDFTMGMPASVITTTVDVGDFVAEKRAAMVAHASQIPDDSFFLQLPLEAFKEAFGQEWYIHRGEQARTDETWLYES
jgi:LmbE family N-acetylglucosaminyl deacetylase